MSCKCPGLDDNFLDLQIANIQAACIAFIVIFMVAGIIIIPVIIVVVVLVSAVSSSSSASSLLLNQDLTDTIKALRQCDVPL